MNKHERILRRIIEHGVYCTEHECMSVIFDDTISFEPEDFAVIAKIEAELLSGRKDTKEASE